MVRLWQILLQKSAARDWPVGPDARLRRVARRALRNSNATRYTEPVSVAAGRPAMRAVANSEQWRLEQTRPGHLVDHVVEVDRASGCALSAQTASRSSWP